MAENTARKRDPIQLLKIYGNLEFDWDLMQDTIHWEGPLNRLVSPDIPLSTGSSFNNCLDPQNFWTRMNAISEGAAGNHTYECEYRLNLSGHRSAHVFERGKILFDGDDPTEIEGILRIDDEDFEEQNSLSGYDELTGFPGKEVLFENLASLLHQAEETKVPGAYLAFAVDQLGYLTCKYDVKTVSEIVKAVGEALRKTIRFDDYIGRTSGTGLGIILKDCDRWGIVRASDRLSKCVEDQKIETSKGHLSIRISAGGIVFPEKGLSAEEVMHKAEKCLFEAQNIKGMGVSWTPYSPKVVQDLARPSSGTAKPTEGRRRTGDSTTTSKKA